MFENLCIQYIYIYIYIVKLPIGTAKVSDTQAVGPG